MNTMKEVVKNKRVKLTTTDTKDPQRTQRKNIVIAVVIDQK